MTRAVTYIEPPGLGRPLGLYSHATRADARCDFVFVAGQLSVDGDGQVVGAADFAAQMRQVYANFGLVLAGVGAGFGSVVQFTTYLTDADNIDDFYSVRAELFPTLFPAPTYPPNTLLVVQRLVQPEFLIEVEGIALVTDDGSAGI